jgi:L-ribulokinase
MPMGTRFTIGLDFGTESARALLVDTSSGSIASKATFAYPDGVIDERLPGTSIRLPHTWALQNPRDWLAALDFLVPTLLRQSGAGPSQIVGVGVDFTAATILPTTADGTPLCALDDYRTVPHAWPKLWKHHGAQPQADRMNQIASQRGETFPARYGGLISSEWLIPKALSILEEAPDVYSAAARLLEAGDWIVWQLTGVESRNSCAAGYKGCWNKQSGYPSPEYLRELHPDLELLPSAKLGGDIRSPGDAVSSLAPEWAQRLGLRPGTAVAAAIIDAHSAVLGAGVAQPGVMVLVMGTSSCQILLDQNELSVEGICGVVEDGIVPGLFAYEAGQAGVGDIFGWFIEQGVPPSYHDEARQLGTSLFSLLGEKAAHLLPGASGLLALDWWNGCRSPLVDAGLSGVILGLNLATKPEEIYRALIEATAFGARLIIDTFERQGLHVERLVATGGLTRNAMLMQIYANVVNRQIAVTSTEQASGLGAAILGARAAGKQMGGYDSLVDATGHMAAGQRAVYSPDPIAVETYDILYREYARLVDMFGRQPTSPLRVLRRLRVLSQLGS